MRRLVHGHPARPAVPRPVTILERQAIHRGTYTSVRDLNAKIRAFITGWNDRAHPFAWTKTAEQVLKKANRKKTSDARH